MEINFQNILTIFFAVAAIFSALMMIIVRNPVNSILYLVLNFFCVSVIYLILQAQFIAIIQIIVYAGAIMVLFLFVVMLLNLQDEKKFSEHITYKKLSAILLSIFFFLIVSITVYFTFKDKYKVISPEAENLGKVEVIGRELYTTFSFPFELVSFILLSAIVGAIILAKKKFE